MKYSKKGITVISVTIIIIVLLILAGTVTVSTNHIIKSTYEKEFIREYKLIESQVKDYVMRNSGNVDFDETTVNLTTIEAKYLNQFDGEKITDNMINMYVIDLEKIGVENTTYGIELEEGDVYLFSKETNTVYYKKGFETENHVYYKVIYE